MKSLTHIPNSTRWTAGATQVAAGEEKEIDEKEQEINHRQPRSDAARNDKWAVAQEKNAAQNQRGEDEDHADEIDFAGGGQGGKSGDDQQEERGLEEMLDLRRSQRGMWEQRTSGTSV